MARRTIPALLVLSLVFLVASPAEGRGTKARACGVSEYSYAGLQSDTTAHGVAATLVATAAPAVSDGHVGGWIGVGGTDGGPGGSAEWIQTGLASFAPDNTIRMYYEVTVAGSDPRYFEIQSKVAPGEQHRFSLLEMNRHNSFWRVWVDGRPVSAPIYLPGSHGAWYPQALAESWNGGVGACNGYSYRFTNVELAHANGGSWRPLADSEMLQDPGYRVVPAPSVPRGFVTTSVS